MPEKHHARNIQSAPTCTLKNSPRRLVFESGNLCEPRKDGTLISGVVAILVWAKAAEAETDRLDQVRGYDG
jgi:hypothetical protein